MPIGRQVLGHDKVLSEHLIMFLMETFLRANLSGLPTFVHIF